MKDFEYIYKDRKMRNKPWFRLRGEETSYIIYNCYRNGVIDSEEIQDFLKKHRIQFITFYLYPILAAYPTKILCQSLRHKFTYYNHKVLNICTLAGVSLSWLLFSKISPFNKQYEQEKEKVLEYLDNNIGYSMLKFNAMLPRYWTENRVNGFTRKLYRQYNPLFFKMTALPQLNTNPIIDEDEVPLNL